MAELANECVIVVESDGDDDDDDIIVVDEHGNPSEHDVIFVRRDRRKTGSNQPLPDKILPTLSEDARNKPTNNTAECMHTNLDHLLSQLDSPEQPSTHGDDKHIGPPKVKVLSNGTVTWNSDLKPLQPAPSLPRRSPDDKFITNGKLRGTCIADLLSPASPDTSIHSTDVAASNSPSPFLDNKGCTMWSPASPDASKHSSGITRRRFPSQFSCMFSPDAGVNNAGKKHRLSHCSDDMDTTVLSPVSPAASTDSTDTARKTCSSPLSDTTSLCSPDASLDSADFYGKHSAFRCSSDDSALSNPCSPTKSTDSNDSDTVVAVNLSSSPFSHSYNSHNASISGTTGSNSPPPFSSDGSSSSPASPCASVGSASMSVTVKRGFTANHQMRTDDKNTGTSCHVRDAMSVLAKTGGDTVVTSHQDTVVTSQQTVSSQQDCTCNVLQGMCRTCIDNLDKTKTVASPLNLTVQSHHTPSMSFTGTQTQTRSAIVINNTHSSKVMLGIGAIADGNTPPTNTIVSNITLLPTAGFISVAPRPITNACVPHAKRLLGGASNGMLYPVIVSKKQRLCPSTSQPQPGTSRLLSRDRCIDHNLCFGCGILITAGNLSECLDQHRCCSQCLQQQAKSLLTKQSKGSLKCFFPGCDSFYPLSQLRKTLPAMVIEIVEEKLEQESLENATKFMMGQIGEVSGEDRKERVDPWTLPRDWEPMDMNGDMKTVEVMEGSGAFNDVAMLFHSTMHAPRAHIVRIRRVQNPILWQFYSVKRRQMLQEIGIEELREMKLFHGTSSSVVDAICKGNFDWRLCGTHGTVFGQGSYFARDAKYAHMYTDGGNATLRTNPGTAGLPVQSYLSVVAPQLSLYSGFAPGISPVAVGTGSAPIWQNTVVSGLQQCRSKHTMFMARVLVGKYTFGYPALRKPPALDPNDIYGKCYDSCVNDVTDPRIYVIFDNAQYYPEFIIEYTNIPRWAQ